MTQAHKMVQQKDLQQQMCEDSRLNNLKTELRYGKIASDKNKGIKPYATGVAAVDKSSLKDDKTIK